MTQRPSSDTGPSRAFHGLIDSGELKPDAGQIAAITHLQSLHDALRDYRLGARGGIFGSIKRLFGSVGRAAPRGLYIHGPVGRGKSMLMDLFFETVTAPSKRRTHFHAFMIEVQERLKGYRAKAVRDPLAALAAEISAETSLLCFDEFHVVNIADAMILGRLFEGFFSGGTVVVATSNVAPEDLYRDGLQRRNFLPFIELIQDRMDIIDIREGDDHRRFGLAGQQVFFTPLGAQATAALDRIFADMTVGMPSIPRVFTVQGRSLEVPQGAGGVARFTFDDLCRQPLGAADYLTIAAHFHCVVLDDVPALTAAERSAAKRFVVLIDALYEHKVKLICSADAEPDALYPSGDTAFEFQRAASRLIEMQSQAYLKSPHMPPGEQPIDASTINPQQPGDEGTIKNSY